MSVETALILAFLAFLVGWFWKKPTVGGAERNPEADLRSRLDSIERTLEEMQSRLDDLPVKPGVEDKRRFKSAQAIALDDVRRWAQGDTMQLISKSYYYPAKEPDIVDFEYRHDRVETTERNHFGFEVHGYTRWSLTDEWTPYKFLANQEECTTSLCEGTIRRLF